MYLRTTKEAEDTEVALRDFDSSSPAPFKHGVGFIKVFCNASNWFISFFSQGLNVPVGTVLAPSHCPTSPLVPVWGCDWACHELPTTQEWPETMGLFLTDQFILRLSFWHRRFCGPGQDVPIKNLRTGFFCFSGLIISITVPWVIFASRLEQRNQLSGW